MSEKVRAAKIVAALEALYPEAVCSLTYDEPWKLLFSARLAAQCTDKRVNEVAKTLYLKYPTLQAMADADLSELEETIRSTGLFRTKARDLSSPSLFSMGTRWNDLTVRCLIKWTNF